MRHELFLSATLIAILLLCGTIVGQQSSACQAKSPRDAVDQFWRMATRGEFLAKDGWKKESVFFAEPSSTRGDVAYVASDYWEINDVTVTGNKAEVTVGFDPAGQVDSRFRYTRPRQTDAIKQAMVYRLTCAPTHHVDYYVVEGSDLKPHKIVEGPPAWQFDGTPKYVYATVNSAIRYVLEAERTTKDPTIRKNADESLTKLLRLR